MVFDKVDNFELSIGIGVCGIVVGRKFVFGNIVFMEVDGILVVLMS